MAAYKQSLKLTHLASLNPPPSLPPFLSLPSVKTAAHKSLVPSLFHSDFVVRAAAQVPPPLSDSPQLFSPQLARTVPVTGVIQQVSHATYSPPRITAFSVASLTLEPF